MIFLHKIVSDEYKKTIENKINDHLENNPRDIDVYYDGLIYDVLQPNLPCENCLFSEVQRNTNTTGIIITSTNYIPHSATLYLNDKLLKKERFIKIIQNDASLGLIIDPRHYNYKKFNPELLLTFTQGALQKISEDEEAKQTISKCLKEYLVKNWNVELTRIYIKFFS